MSQKLRMAREFEANKIKRKRRAEQKASKRTPSKIATQEPSHVAPKRKSHDQA